MITRAENIAIITERAALWHGIGLSVCNLTSETWQVFSLTSNMAGLVRTSASEAAVHAQGPEGHSEDRELPTVKALLQKGTALLVGIPAKLNTIPG